MAIGRFFAIALAVLALEAPGAATAASTTRIPAAPVSGPVVAGGEAVWASARRDGGFELMAAAPGGDVRTFASFPTYRVQNRYAALTPRLSSYGDQIALAVGASQIQTSRYEDYLGPLAADVLTGPVKGQLVSVLHCMPGTAGPEAAISARGVVHSGPDCDAARAGGFAFRDSGSGESRPLTPDGGEVRAGGPYVAWTNGDATITVYDLDRQAVAYRIDEQGQIAAWDLQDDGKVALALRPSRDAPATLSWYSPTEPAPHGLGIAAADDWNIRMAADRIAFIRSYALTGGRTYFFGALEVTDLTGNRRAVADRAIGVGRRHPTFDFDGTNVTWTAPACFGALLETQSVDEPGRIAGVRPRCRLAFRKRPRVLMKEAIRVPLRCSGYAPFCGGSIVRLEIARTGQRLGSGEARFCDDTADVPLPRGRWKMLRRHRAVRVRAVATTTDIAGARERRVTTFTLRPRDVIKRDDSCVDP